MKYLGIDYGTKRIGIALSNDEGTLAFPKCVLENKDEWVSKLLDIIDQESVQVLVIGESVNLDGQHNVLMRDIERFIFALEKEISLPIHLEKEGMSSVAAQAHLYGKGNIANEKWTGKANAKKREHNDANAATIILQRYLDKK